MDRFLVLLQSFSLGVCIFIFLADAQPCPGFATWDRYWTEGTCAEPHRIKYKNPTDKEACRCCLGYVRYGIGDMANSCVPKCWPKCVEQRRESNCTKNQLSGAKDWVNPGNMNMKCVTPVFDIGRHFYAPGIGS